MFVFILGEISCKTNCELLRSKVLNRVAIFAILILWKKYNIAQMAELLNVSGKTLQQWDREGALISQKTPTNRRFYARVSNRNQKDDLINRMESLKQYANANGNIVNETIENIGIGLNYKRKKWNKLLNKVMDGKIDSIFIAHKDRFIRFSFV